MEPYAIVISIMTVLAAQPGKQDATLPPTIIPALVPAETCDRFAALASESARLRIEKQLNVKVRFSTRCVGMTLEAARLLRDDTASTLRAAGVQ